MVPVCFGRDTPAATGRFGAAFRRCVRKRKGRAGAIFFDPCGDHPRRALWNKERRITPSGQKSGAVEGDLGMIGLGDEKTDYPDVWVK